MVPPREDSPAVGTLAVHAGEDRLGGYAALAVPIVATSTYAFESEAELARYHAGEVEREEYGRYGNPTARAAERKVAALDGTADALLFSSGMAAITTTLLSMLKSGQHVVLTRDCYRRTRQFVGTVLARYGITSTLVDPGDWEGIAAAIDPSKTRVVISESPSNPWLRVVDMERLADLKKKHRALKFIIDSTFATPVNQRPAEWGVDLVLHSATKYLGGHNDLLAGTVSGGQPLIEAIREFRGVMGGVLDPHAAYLLIRGMKTLSLRVERQNATAQRVAETLERDPRVERVSYPGLASHPDHAHATRQMKGFGAVVSFVVRGDGARAARFIDACELATIAPSLGGVDTLIERPASMSHHELSSEERTGIGIPDSLVRLSVGVEDPDDIVDDLTRALDLAFAGEG